MRKRRIIYTALLMVMAVMLSQCVSFEFSASVGETATPEAVVISDTLTPRATAVSRPSTTLTPSPTKLGSVLAPLATVKSGIDTGVVRPTEPAKMLRFVRESLNESPKCVAVRIQGIDTGGWSVTIDGLKLSGEFDENGVARVCGLRAGAEFTFTVRDAKNTPVAGGSGVPARDTAVMVAEWK